MQEDSSRSTRDLTSEVCVQRPVVCVLSSKSLEQSRMFNARTFVILQKKGRTFFLGTENPPRALVGQLLLLCRTHFDRSPSRIFVDVLVREEVVSYRPFNSRSVFLIYRLHGNQKCQFLSCSWNVIETEIWIFQRPDQKHFCPPECFQINTKCSRIFLRVLFFPP